MEKSKIDMFFGMNAENFHPYDIGIIKEKLEKLDDDKFYMIQATQFQKPSMILLIAIFLGWERFWLDDIALGVVKIITIYGCGIWWLIDLFTAQNRAKNYNLKKLTQTLSYL
ncbi:MAG: TM2 domain-containing protein [Bacteroidetes bacterium]|nr:TM2 domain-containing protein [Bacteroidota bacterium]